MVYSKVGYELMRGRYVLEEETETMGLFLIDSKSKTLAYILASHTEK